MVVNKASLSSPKLSKFLAASPHHFYVTFTCSGTDQESWRSRTSLSGNSRNLTLCDLCYKACKCRTDKLDTFSEAAPLRAFDPFAGVGAFALAMQESGALTLTHAIEISPSAARTLKLVSFLVIYHTHQHTLPPQREFSYHSGLQSMC